MALKIGLTPEIGLLNSSKIVMEMTEEETLLATTGVVPLIVVVTLLGDPGVKTTVPSALITGVAIERVFVSALVDFNVQVDTPSELEEEQRP